MTNRQKNIGLIIGSILMLLICYKFGIAKTIVQYNEYDRLSQEQILFENMPKHMAVLNHKKHYYDSILGAYQLKGTSIQNNLIKVINAFSDDKGITVVGFEEPHLEERDDLTIKTYRFTLEGEYKDLLALIHQLEQKTKFGEVICLDFEKKKNHRTGKFYLQASVLLRSLG
jgi:hypothetical protein